jgi:hypothetical protein
LEVSIVDLMVANAAFITGDVYTLVWKHTNKWWNKCTFQIPSAKENSNVVI